MYTKAIVRRPGPNFADGKTTSGLGKPDYEKALEQHSAYCETLNRCGISVIILEADERYPDGCFVEDTAVITDDFAVITRPGADSRIGEEDEMERIISKYKKCFRINAPGTLDGGDVLRAENHFFIGLSQRTNRAGAEQLATIVAEFGYSSSFVSVGEGLHLKSGIAYIGKNNYLTIPDFSEGIHEGNSIIPDEEEGYSANSLFVNGYLLIASGFPGMKEKILRLDYTVIELDMSEFRKMDGGLTCLSLLFNTK